MDLVEMIERAQWHNADFTPIADEGEGSTAIVTQPEVLRSLFPVAPRGWTRVRGGKMLGQEELALLQKTELG